MVGENAKVTGTLIWYYYVCKREVWLISHEIYPEQSNTFLELGRIIHEDTYKREKKEFAYHNMVIDFIRKEGEQIVVAEIKKSSRFQKPALMQLAFYLQNLKSLGTKARGELLVPKEKKKKIVELTSDIEEELEHAKTAIKNIINLEQSPPPVKIRFCRNCAYKEFCWS